MTARRARVAKEPPAPEQAPIRHRFTSFGKVRGEWRARRALALQDMIDAGQGTREWDTGLTYQGPGVVIESEPGGQPITPAEHLLAQALAFHRRHGAAAIVRAATKIADAKAVNDPDAIVLRSEIVEELKTIKVEALRAERGRR